MFRLNATWSKQSFYSDATTFLQWDRKFQMNAVWKSPHLAELAHIDGPAHLIWVAPKNNFFYRTPPVAASESEGDGSLQHAIEGIINMAEGIIIPSKKQYFIVNCFLRHIYAALEFKSQKCSYSKYSLFHHPFCRKMSTYGHLRITDIFDQIQRCPTFDYICLRFK